MLEKTQLSQRKKSFPNKDTNLMSKLSSALKKWGGKKEPIHKIQVYLSSSEVMDNSIESNKEKKNMSVKTEALRPLIIKPKDNALLFKNKLPEIKDKKVRKIYDKAKKANLYHLQTKVSGKTNSQKIVFSSQEKARNVLGLKSQKGKKLERYLRSGGL